MGNVLNKSDERAIRSKRRMSLHAFEEIDNGCCHYSKLLYFDKDNKLPVLRRTETRQLIVSSIIDSYNNF